MFIFPTFLDESRATLRRLKTVRARHPAAGARPRAGGDATCEPTLRDVGRLAPDLKALFRDLDPLIDESPKTRCRRPRGSSRGAEPLFEGLHPYLQELNPILSYLNFQQQQVADFITNGGGSLNATLPPLNAQRGPAPLPARLQRDQRARRGHRPHAPELRPRQRLPGAQLPAPRAPAGHHRGVRLQADRRRASSDATNGEPPCFVAPKSLFDGGQFPTVGRGEAPVRCATRPATWAPSRPPRERMPRRRGRRRARRADGARGAGTGRASTRPASRRATGPAGCGPTARRCRAPTARCTSTPAARAPSWPASRCPPTGPTSRRTSTSASTSRATSTHAGVGDRIRYGAAVDAAERGGRRRLDVSGRGRLRGRVRRARGGQRPQLGAARCPTRRTRARSTGARCTRTTTARPTSSPAGACWSWGWATRRWTSRSSRRPSPSATLPVHPLAAPGSCPSTCSASRPTRSPRPPWRGCRGSCASRSPTLLLRVAVGKPESYGLPRRVGRLPARPPHDLRRRALAARPTARSRCSRASSRSTATAWCSPTGRASEVDMIVWCTGYRVTVPYLDDDAAGRAAGRAAAVQADVPPRARRPVLHRPGADHRLGHPGGRAPERSCWPTT